MTAEGAGAGVTVDVVIPAYNSATSIAECVRSALSQSVQNLRVIVVDDCSTDSTRSVVGELFGRDPRVVLVSSEMNGGAGAARKKGLQRVQAEFLAFLDADDIWLPTHLESAMTVMATRKDVAITHAGRLLNTGPNKHYLLEKKRTGYTRECEFALRNPIVMSSAVLRTSLENFREMPTVRARQDYIYWRYLLKSNPMAGVWSIGKPTVIYNAEGAGLSGSLVRNVRLNYHAFRRAEGAGRLKASLLVTLNVVSKIFQLATRKQVICHSKRSS